MRRILFAIVLVSFALGSFPQAVAAAPGSPLCLPSTYSPSAANCLPYGPSEYLSRLLDLGLSFPLRELPTGDLESELIYLPYSYAKVTNQPAPVFISLENAIEGDIVKRYIEAGSHNFISYIDVREVEGKKYYMIAPGEWMTGNHLSVGVAYAQFMGLTLQATPKRDFGWILQPTQISTSAGAEAAPTARWLTRWDVIQVYDVKQVNELKWYLIGPNQWVESRKTALVYPATEAPAGIENGRWIEINLLEQTVSVYEDNQMVYATLVSTGVAGYWTRPGLFQVYEKLDSTLMTGSFEADRSDYYYLEDVPWTMYFDEARAFHGAYWHTKFGYEQSAGCANLSSGDSQWLYQWANLGDWVYVWDPSGRTPTDATLYGAGGA